MAEIIQQPKVEVSATMRFNEEELRALDALVGYGVDGFLKVFYEKLGKAYMEPHEAGLRELFESVRRTVPSILRRADDARMVFTGQRVATKLGAQTEAVKTPLQGLIESCPKSGVETAPGSKNTIA